MYLTTGTVLAIVVGGAGGGTNGGDRSGGRFGAAGGGGVDGGGGGGGYSDGSGSGAWGWYLKSELTDTFAVGGTLGGNGQLVVAEVLCNLHGTLILTPTGAVLVKALSIVDAVVTRFGPIQRIKSLGRQSYAPRFIANTPEKWPV